MLTMRPAIPGFLLGHGAAGAGLVLMGYLLAYLIRFEALLGHWSTPYVLTVVVSVMVMVLLTVRKEEGMLSFGRAFGLSLLAGFLVRLGYNAFMLLLFHVDASGFGRCLCWARCATGRGSYGGVQYG